MKRLTSILTLLALLISPVIQAGTPDLKQQYAAYNAQYFENRLPKNAVVFFAPVGAKNEMGETATCGSYICIRIDPDYNKAPRVASMTLLHEMCHTATLGQDLNVHGAHWQACMYRLTAIGAFNDLW